MELRESGCLRLRVCDISSELENAVSEVYGIDVQ
jgi:hypothetical protein